MYSMFSMFSMFSVFSMFSMFSVFLFSMFSRLIEKLSLKLYWQLHVLSQDCCSCIGALITRSTTDVLHCSTSLYIHVHVHNTVASVDEEQIIN